MGALSPTAVGVPRQPARPVRGIPAARGAHCEREYPEILGPVAEGDYERALAWLLDRAMAAEPAEKNRVREVMVAIFEELGQEHPLATAYRRRLATALY
ncbi:MAG: tetratricopeptide repeat protein [Thermoleophilia bacterium]